MKPVLLSLVPLLLFAFDLTVIVDDLRMTKGELRIGLYDDEEDFRSTTRYFDAVSIPLKSKRIKHTFSDIPEGRYAVSIFHDEDGDARLDKNLFGIPQEGYGFSNDPAISFRAPGFQACSFKIEQDRQIIIKMHY
jgi:uncharacterized protein (DUF2141 family)